MAWTSFPQAMVNNWLSYWFLLLTSSYAYSITGSIQDESNKIPLAYTNHGKKTFHECCDNVESSSAAVTIKIRTRRMTITSSVPRCIKLCLQLRSIKTQMTLTLGTRWSEVTEGPTALKKRHCTSVNQNVETMLCTAVDIFFQVIR